jgi:hypothetical protein
MSDEQPLRRHVFTPSGQRAFGHRICTCGSREKDSIHRVPEVTDEQRRHEQRRVGERESK